MRNEPLPNGCKFHVPGYRYCNKPVVGQSLGIDACQDCIDMTHQIFQKIGELGIPVRSLRPDGKVPVEIDRDIQKGKIKKAKAEIRRPKITN